LGEEAISPGGDLKNPASVGLLSVPKPGENGLSKDTPEELGFRTEFKAESSNLTCQVVGDLLDVPAGSNANLGEEVIPLSLMKANESKRQVIQGF
jgi:hypothetical protein